MENNALQHYGILGMRWGIRRYQNYDGTYTNTGKRRKRLDQEGASNSSSANQNTSQQTQTSSQPTNSQQGKTTDLTQPKPASEMTDQELRDFLSRIDMERRYNDYINSMTPKIDPVEKEIKDLKNQLELKNLNNQLNPKKEKKTSAVAEIIGPALKSVASQYVKNKLEDALIKKTEDPDKKKIDKLKKKVEIKELNERLSKQADKKDNVDKEIDSLRKRVELKELNDRLSGKSDSKDPTDAYIKQLETEWKIGNLQSKIGALKNTNSNSASTNSTSKKSKESNDSDDYADVYSVTSSFLKGHRQAASNSGRSSQNNWQTAFDSLFTEYTPATSGSKGKKSQSIWDRPLDDLSESGSSSSSWLDRYIERSTRKIG